MKKISPQGTWTTKSNAKLGVIFSFDTERLQEFLYHVNPGTSTKDPDIQGLRMYTGEGISKGSKDANEWHKFRDELVFVIKGSLSWTVQDRNNQKNHTFFARTVTAYGFHQVFSIRMDHQKIMPRLYP